MLYQISNQAKSIYSDLLKDSSLMQKIYTKYAHYPETSKDEKHQFALEILSRILTYDELKTSKVEYVEDEWRSLLHDEITSNEKWQTLLEECHSTNINLASCCAMTWLVQSIGYELPYMHELTYYDNNLAVLRGRVVTAKKMGFPHDAINSQLKKIESAYKLIIDYMQPILQAVVERALKEALKSLEPTIAGVITGDIPGMSQKSLIEKVKATMVYSTKGVREVLALLGSMISQFKVKTSQSKDAVYSWDYGNNIPNLVLDEFLKDDDLFYLEFAEEKLVQRSHGKSPESNGPVVILLDESSSMGYVLSSTNRYVWAKAFALLVAKIGKQQNRDIYLIGFGGKVEYEIDLKNATPENIATAFDGCHNLPHTNWKAPLNKGVDIIKHSHKYKQSDILIITDGEDPSIEHDTYYLQKITELKKELNFKVQGILVGDKSGEKTLNLIADSVITVTSLQDTTKLSSVVESI